MRKPTNKCGLGTKDLLNLAILSCLAFLLFNLQAQAQVCSPASVGLVSWWSADGNALDSRSRLNGTLVGNTAFAVGQAGQAFNFDGNNDSIQIGHNSSHNFNGNFTVEVWIFPRTLPNIAPRVIGKDSGAGIFWQLNIVNDGTSSNALSFNANGVILTTPNNSISLNQWSHIAVTVSPSNVRIYVNGLESASTPQTASSNNNAPLKIGDDFAGTRGFDGLIDEASIYSRPLSASEIQSIFNAGTGGKCKPTATVAPSGQVGWWPGDGNTNDISGNGNHGAFPINPRFAVSKIGQGFNHNGEGNNVVVPFTPSFNLGAAVTIEAWVNPTSTVTLDNKLIAGRAINYQIAKLTDGRLNFTVVIGGNFIAANSTSTLPANTPTHVVGTYDAATGQIRVFMNGVLEATTIASGNLDNSNQPFEIGGFSVFGNHFQGQTDEVSLYNRALTQDEISSIFNAGIAGKLKDNTTATGSNVAVNMKSDAVVTFPTVSSAGTTQQIPLDLSLLPALPLGVSSAGLTYDLATSAGFSGSPQVCFNLPSITDPTVFGNLRIGHLESGVWVNRTDLASINFATKTICTSGLTSLSPFTLLNGFAPVAANVSISGRVTTVAGFGIPGTEISITRANGETRTTRTGSFGYYRFDDLPVGETYVLSISAKRYVFIDPTRIINLNAELTDVDFIAAGK